MKHNACFRYKQWMIAIVLAFSCVMSARPSMAGEIDIYGAIESYTWKEFGDNDQRFLEESGALIGVGFAYWREFGNHVTVKPAAEIFGGTVDYDGQACNSLTGVCFPSTTKVDYFGVKLAGDAGRRFRPGENSFVEPFGGLGVRIWERNIRDGKAANGATTSGYVEEWITLHARLGVRGGQDLAPGKQLIAEAGVKLPLYNENTAYLSRKGLGPDVTMHPGKTPSFFAELGIKLNRFKGSLFYEGLRFSKSDEVTTTDGRYIYSSWQPRSAADIYGVRLGASF